MLSLTGRIHNDKNITAVLLVHPERAGLIRCHDLGRRVAQRSSAVHILRTILGDRIKQTACHRGQNHDSNQHNGEQGNDKQGRVVNLPSAVFGPSVHAISPFHFTFSV